MFKIIEFENLSSTNKFSLEKIDYYPSDTVIRAQIQSAGRGRFDRKWISDKKDNCYISFILKPNIKYRENFANLTQYLSIVLCELICQFGVFPEIKWPNDVLINGKKIAGILSEVSFSGEHFNGIVLGVGVNLNLQASEIAKLSIPATSLNIEISKHIDSDIFVEQLVEKFFENYDVLLKEGFSYFRAQYISFSNFIGKQVTIKNPNIQNLGMAINVCEDGAIEILTANGETKKFFSGDIIL